MARGTKSLVAPVVASALLAAGLVWTQAPPTQADPLPGGVEPVTKLADYASWHRQPGSRPDTANPALTHNSLNPGRIWTDKTVFRNDTEASAGGVDHDLNIADDEMAVVLSALGTTRQVQSTRRPVIDLVLVLDNSFSMVQCVGVAGTNCNTQATYRNSRAYAMVQGVNAAIQHIVAADPAARVSMVAFGNGATTLTGLGPPQTVNAAGEYVEFVPPPTSNSTTMTLNTAGVDLQVGTVSSTTQSTNIHRGIDRGMSILASQQTEAVAGFEQHIPSLILFSDGEPTLSASESRWWNLSGTTNQGPGSPGTTQYYGNGFLPALSAAYRKNQVTDVYNNEAFNAAHGFSPVETNIYTVGLGMNVLSGQGQRLAFATLNPAELLPAQGATGPNDMANAFGTAMTRYRNNTSTTVSVGNGLNFTVNRPSGEVSDGERQVTATTYDPTYEELRYNTTFDSPNTAEELLDVFERIASEVITEEPTLPVETTTPDPNTDGYVTFTDPLGPFMRVSEMNSIVFCSILRDDDPTGACDPLEFFQKSATVNGNTTTYAFGGSYQANDLFPETALSNIIITVESNASLAVGDIVTVRIPVALLPMINTTVLEDPNGEPRSMRWWNSHPVHVYYKVAPKEGVAAALTDPTQLAAADQQALAAYVAANTSADNRLRFYANDFTEGSPREARAFATFRPSTLNDFYRFAQEAVLYRLVGGEHVPISPTEWAAMGDDDQVFRTVVQYKTDKPQGEPPEKLNVYLPTTKALLLQGQTATARIRANGLNQMVAPAGLYNLSGRITNLDMPKCAEADVRWTDDTLSCAVVNPASNITDTAPYARDSAVDPGAAQSVQINLGNNGVLEYVVPGAFEIGKTVTTAHAGLTPDPDQQFTFTVTLTPPAGGTLDASYPYRVFDAQDQSVRTGTIASGGTVTLTAGQYVRVMGLPDGAGFSVVEEDPPSPPYTPVAPDVTSGTITVPQSTVPRLEWRNDYTVAPETIATVQATKQMQPSWLDGTYRMRLCPIGNAPVPEDGDATTGCVTASVTAEGQVVGFGDVTFSVPDTYTYSLVELPTEIPGVTDSLAQFRWQVVVTDDGQGHLQTATTLSRIADDAGQGVSEPVAPPATFTNTWTTGPLSRGLEIFKRVHDASLTSAGQLRPPEIPYYFTFSTMEPDPDDPAPLFLVDGSSDTSATVQSTPGTIRVPSPPLQYTVEHVGSTYYYKVEEEPFDPPMPGVTLSDAVWFFRVDVQADGTGADTRINPVLATCETTKAAVTPADPFGDCGPLEGNYAPEDDGPEFVNVSEPDPVDVALTATKTLDGRPWGPGDEFTFDLAAADADTQDAIDAGHVVLPVPATATASAPASGASAQVTFGDITFTRQGVYRFAVSERAPPTTPGLTPDSRTVVYTVTVTDLPVDNGTARDGQLEAEVTVAGDDDELTNTFRAVESFTNVAVNKTLDGREQVAREFSFTVTAADAESRDKLGWSQASQSFTNTTDGPEGQPVEVVRLPEIVFTQDDIGQTYTYEIVENDTGAGGVTYDDTEFTVAITPQYDFDDNVMWVETVVTGSDGSETTYDSRDGEAPSVGFLNTYVAAPGTATIPFEKRIVGRDWRPGDTFTFELTGLDGAPMPAESQVEVTTGSQSGSPGFRSGEFGPITFTQAGDYTYEIREVPPSDPLQDMVYDLGQVLTVTVRVTDDLAGNLQTEVIGPVQVFENLYRTPYHYEVGKRLDGRDMADGEFSVRVVPESQEAADITDGQVPYPDGVTFPMPAAADGVVALVQRSAAPLLTEEALGQTYCYVYSEEVPTPPLPGVTYDTMRFRLCTTPTMRQDGMMQATTVISDADTGEVLTTVETSEDDVEPAFPQIVFQNDFHSWTLTKRSDPASGSTVQPGSTVTYTLTATNTASTTLSGAEAVDDLTDVLAHGSLGALPGGLTLSGTDLTWAIPDIAPGESVSVSYDVRIDDAAVGVTIRNTVTGAGEVPAPEACPENDAGCRETVLHTPRWTLTKGSDPVTGATVLPGDTITYTLTATNAAEVADLSGAVAVDDLSDVLPYASLGALPPGVTLDGTTLRWAVPDLAPGEQATVSYTVTVTGGAAGQTLRNVVTGAGTAPAPDPCPEEDQACRATEHLVPAWTLAKSADPASGSAVSPGDTITYTLTATNTGPAPLTGARATDDLAGVLDNATLGSLAPGLTLAANGTTLLWAIPALAVGETTTVSYTVTVNAGAWGATLSNTVSGAGPVPPADCATPPAARARSLARASAGSCATEHLVPSWTLRKTSDPASGSVVDPGTVIAYTLTVRNDGPAALRGAVVTDDMSQVLGGADLVRPLAAGLSLSGTTLTWQVPEVDGGDQVSVTYRVSVNDDARDATLHNVAAAGPGGACDGCTTDHLTAPQGALPATGAVFGRALLILAGLLILLGAVLVLARRRHDE